MRKEPRDCGGRVKAFWNQAIFDCRRCSIEVVDTQPKGQVMASRIGLGLEDEKGRSGNLSRYCGRPGKKQIKKRTRKVIVRLMD